MSKSTDIAPDAIMVTMTTPPAAPKPLDSNERNQLFELETIISTGWKGFIKVAKALAKIRDLRLYRSEFGSFEEYCDLKWDYSKQHVYRLIACAPIAESNPQVTSLNQARALAKVPATERAEVIEAASAKAQVEGRPMTAKDITAAAKPIAMNPPPPGITLVDARKVPQQGSTIPADGTKPAQVIHCVMAPVKKPKETINILTYEPVRSVAIKYQLVEKSNIDLQNWYSRASKPNRAEFLLSILTNYDIEVQDKAEFQKVVNSWLEHRVTEAPKSTNVTE